MSSESGALGFFGNIWVRQNYFPTAGMVNTGHKHDFDHVTLLAKGKVSVVVEGHPPKEFTAPTFIVIRKDHSHEITALEDDTLWYCVFAIRDVDGDIVDIYDETHDPFSVVFKGDAKLRIEQGRDIQEE